MYDRHIVIDLEFTPIARCQRELRKVMRDEIIQIGAVMLDENYRFVDSFTTFVKPRFVDCITPSISDLTGIHDRDIANAPDLSVALDKLSTWIGDGHRVRVYSWSDTDLWQLDTECWVKELDFPRNMGRWIDFQRIYCRIVGCSKRVSLKNAVDSANISFSGSAHTALWDAMATSELLRMTVLEKDYAEKCRMLRSAFCAKPHGSTLGDLLGAQLMSCVA